MSHREHCQYPFCCFREFLLTRGLLCDIVVYSRREMILVTLGERIKKVRKTLDLTQQEFADRIGMKRNSIAQVEMGRNTSDQTIYSICREYNVSETWLRTGKGEMLVPSPTSELDALAAKYPQMTHETYVFIEKLASLPESAQNTIMGFLKEVVDGFGDVEFGTKVIQGKNTSVSKTPAKPPRELSDDELHTELDRQLVEEKNQEEGSSVSGHGDSGTVAG